jgi:hypothetical protein
MFFGTVELGGGVPSSAVEQQDGMRALGDVATDLVDVELHGFGVGERQCQRCADPTRWADSAEQVGALVALVGRLAGPRSTTRPLPHDAVLLTYAGLICHQISIGVSLGKSQRCALSVRAKFFIRLDDPAVLGRVTRPWRSCARSRAL